MGALLDEYLASGDLKRGVAGLRLPVCKSTRCGHADGSASTSSWNRGLIRADCCLTCAPCLRCRREAERCLQNLNVPHFHHDFVTR